MEVIANIGKVVLYFAGVQLLAAAVWFNPSLPFLAKAILAPVTVLVLASGIMENFGRSFALSNDELGLTNIPGRRFVTTLLAAVAGAVLCLLLAISAIKLLLVLWPSLYAVNLKSWIAAIWAYQPLSGVAKHVLIGFSLIAYAGAEEFVFRGVLLTYMRRHMPVLYALGASSILFAAVHIHPLYFSASIAMGFVAGYLKIKYRNIWCPVMAHAIYNALLVFGVRHSFI